MISRSPPSTCAATAWEAPRPPSWPKLDEERKVFNFRKVLMINPPVSLYSSVTRIEELLKQIPGGAKKAGHLFQQDAVQVQPVLPLWQFRRHQR